MLALFKISVWMGKSYFVTKKRKKGGKIGFDNIRSFLHQILNRTFLFHLPPQQVIELRTTTLSLNTVFPSKWVWWLEVTNHITSDFLCVHVCTIRHVIISLSWAYNNNALQMILYDKLFIWNNVDFFTHVVLLPSLSRHA